MGRGPSFREGRYRGLQFELCLVRRGRLFDPVYIRGPGDAYRFMRELADAPAEHMYSLNLNGRNALSGVYLVGKGGANRCPADPKEVYKAALMSNSTGVILGGIGIRFSQ